MKTIVNLSTPEGTSAIAIIRLSGKKSFNIIKKIFKKKNNKKIKFKHKKIYLGNIIYKNNIIDEVIIYIYKKPKSYTGENLIEISCHGSIYIQKKLIKIIIKLGAKISLPGEFTYRAFLNKKINLLQADNINNLISSKNKIDHKIFIKQFNNNNHLLIQKIKKKIINILTYLEIKIDFSEENININNKFIYKNINNIILILKKFIKNYNFYKKNKKHYSIIILGNVNTGKSTLFNKIIKKKRAIISNIKGTTRDYIIDNIFYNNKKINIIDSAGIKKITNNIDRICINNTFKILKKINLILFIFNEKTFKKDEKLYNKVLNLLKKKNILKILNKIDIMKKKNILKNKYNNFIKISAKKNININFIFKKIKKYIKLHLNKKKKLYNKNIIINIQYINYIKSSIKNLLKAKKKIKNNSKYYDIIYINIKKSIKYLNKILGININNKIILNNIFSKFCIGK
ncbi:MAG: tRNA uridine-5-carboxymethylaminomethyl(34) synthesis GTPase MnmE [Candidatus Shikimatogenerans sp. Tser]|uniref:tRNA modification GTPase MnmE n=1 Tax=Candidatus Shikimatogenerans sp. Tser TaxID=3158568 RepID=A0AAU7QQG3_9FLAO